MKKNLFLFVGLGLLLLEIGLVVSLRTQGWVETGESAQWTVSLLAAAIPLVLVAVVLVRGRFRFSLRMLLAIVALVALFLIATLLPILDANRARQGTRRLLALGATVDIQFPRHRWSEILKLDAGDKQSPSASTRRELPPWLLPLAGRVLNVPTDRSVRSVTLSADEQIVEFCRLTEDFPDVQNVSVHSAVTPEGLEALRAVLPKCEHLIEVYLHNMRPTQSWLESLTSIHSLWIWQEGMGGNGLSLSPEQMRAIAALPNLQLLNLYGYPVTDADLNMLSECKSLRRISIRYSSVTEAGKQQFKSALPECDMYW